MVPVKTEPNLAPLDSGSHDLVAGLDAASSQFSDHDLLNFVDKKHQAMNKQAKKNQSKTPIKKEAGRQNSQSNIRIPDDMLFPVPEELLLKQGYMQQKGMMSNKKRYFRLLQDSLFAFAAPDTKTPLDEISLDDGSVEDASWVSKSHSRIECVSS